MNNNLFIRIQLIRRGFNISSIHAPNQQCGGGGVRFNVNKLLKPTANPLNMILQNSSTNLILSLSFFFFLLLPLLSICLLISLIRHLIRRILVLILHITSTTIIKNNFSNTFLLTYSSITMKQ